MVAPSGPEQVHRPRQELAEPAEEDEAPQHGVGVCDGSGVYPEGREEEEGGCEGEDPEGGRVGGFGGVGGCRGEWGCGIMMGAAGWPVVVVWWWRSRVGFFGVVVFVEAGVVAGGGGGGGWGGRGREAGGRH